MAVICHIAVQTPDQQYTLEVDSGHLLLADDPAAHVRTEGPQRAFVWLSAEEAPLLDAPGGMRVNGVTHKRVRLAEGDLLEPGAGIQLRYVGLRTGIQHFTLVLEPRIHYGSPAAGQSRRFFVLLAAFLALLLSLPLWVPQLARELPPERNREAGSPPPTAGLALERWVSSGPLHPAHQSATRACADCHVQNQSPVPNAACLSCHTMERHFSRAMTGVHPLCVTCHQEHNEPGNLINSDARLCSQCHADMAQVAAVLAPGAVHGLTAFTHFDGDHPEFSPSETPTHFRFSHAKHLARQLNDDAPLSCSSCHTAEGAGFAAVNFDAHCASCHALETEAPRYQWLHGDLAALVLQAESRALPALAIINGDTCQQCHRARLATLSAEALTQNLTRWQLHTPGLNATFSHKRHEGRLACADCHAASVSERAEDVLLPARADCVSCHNRQAPEPLQQCSSCHQFHRVSWE